MISQTELKRLRQRDDELGQWHATFPGHTPEDILRLLAEGERRGRIAGLREAAKSDRLHATTLTGAWTQNAWLESAESHEKIAERLEKSISSDTPETKTKQER